MPAWEYHDNAIAWVRSVPHDFLNRCYDFSHTLNATKAGFSICNDFRRWVRRVHFSATDVVLLTHALYARQVFARKKHCTLSKVYRVVIKLSALHSIQYTYSNVNCTRKVPKCGRFGRYPPSSPASLSLSSLSSISSISARYPLSRNVDMCIRRLMICLAA